jgi:hypothetical protein
MPYQKSSTCPHASLEAAGRLLADGQLARPFFLYPGEQESAATSPIQFQGQVCQDITWQGVDQDGHHVALLAIVHFVMIADDPNFGRLTIVHDALRPGSVGFLRSVAPGEEFPVIHTTRVHVTAFSDALPGVVLQNRGMPLEFVGEPSSSWPPKDVVYTLKVNISLRTDSTQVPL